MDLYQDSRGFMWIATRKGLNRFDGISFQNFYPITTDSNSLSGNIIRTMTEMPGGLMVIGTNNGLCVFNIYKNRFENFRIHRKDLSPGSNILIRKTFRDSYKNLWVNYNGVLDVFDSLLNYKFRFTDLPQGQLIQGIIIDFNYTVLDNKNNLWIPSDNMGIVQVEPNTLKVTCFKNSRDSLFFRSPIRGFYLDSIKKLIWYSPWGYGLWKYDVLKKKLTKYYFPPVNKAFSSGYNAINGIVPVDSILLCGSETGGLIEFNPVNGHYKFHRHDLFNDFSILSDNINRMLPDRENNLWISTADGLAKASITKSPFQYFSDVFRNKKEEPVPQLLSFALYDSAWLLAGSETKGLFALNTITGEIKHHINPDPLHENENVILNVYVDRNKKIWVGTFDGIYNYNLDKNDLTKPTGIFRSLPKEEVNSIFQDSYGDYWFGFRKGIVLAHYNAKEKTIENYYHEILKKDGDKKFPNSFITKIRETGAGNILFLTVGEPWFVLWNRNENTLTNFPGVQFKNENSSDWLSDILPDKEKNLWFSSNMGHGISHYDLNSGNINRYSLKEGLCNETVKSIVQDKAGNLWLGTLDGLSTFDPSGKKFKNFDMTDGLPDNEFMSNSFFDTRSNLIYMLSPHAIVYFNPGEIKRKSSLQNLYIQKIEINGKDSSIDFTKKLQLSYNQNYINLEFAVVDFKNQNKTSFAYSLDGLDEGWKEAGKNRIASYSNLAPGNYAFKLKSTIGNEDTSSEMHALFFIIHPPFWDTWWFRTLFLFLIVGTIYWIVVLRVRTIRKEEEQKTRFNNQIAEVEMKALRTQMNPHFIFNSLNSINKLILENDTDNASRYLSKFSRLIRMILENSEQRTISLYSEVEMLSAYLEMEAYRFKTKFDYLIDVPEKLNRNDIEIPSMLIQPYVENAIWHGLLPKPGKGELKIIFTYISVAEGNYLSCTIRDNGIGRTKAEELKKHKILNQKSMGMKVTEERMHLLSVANNKKPEVKITDLYEHGVASGTQVDLMIPV